MNIERSLKYPFDDSEWLQKTLIMGLVNIIPIVDLAALGYTLRTGKNIAQGRETPLPDWGDFGDYFVKGLLAFIGSVVYAIPILLFICLGMIFDGATGGFERDNGGIFSLCFGCLSSLWGLVMAVILPAALTRFAISGELGDMFRFGEIFRYISANLGNYIIAVLLFIVVSIAASIVGSIACGIGLILTIPWSMLVAAHLFAQVYNQSQGQAIA